MFIIDKLLIAPFYGIYKIFQEIHEAVKQEQKSSADNIMYELMQLHGLLESGQINEAEFEKREQLLLDKLDDFKKHEIPGG